MRICLCAYDRKIMKSSACAGSELNVSTSVYSNINICDITIIDLTSKDFSGNTDCLLENTFHFLLCTLF